MRRTGGDVIAASREGADRAGGQAGLADAAVAGAGSGGAGRKTGVPIEQQGGAKGMPQPIDRVNIEAERRYVAASGAPSPGQEGQGRLVERKERRCPAALRKLTDDGTGPVVETVLKRIALAGEAI